MSNSRTSIWFLSFAGEDDFLGAVYIRAISFDDAMLKATRFGLNPGGEVLGLEAEEPDAIAAAHRCGLNRLLTEEDMKADGAKKLKDLTEEETGAVEQRYPAMRRQPDPA